MVLFQYVSFCASCVGHFRPTQKYKCMKKTKGCVCLTDPHRNTNVWTKHKGCLSYRPTQKYKCMKKTQRLCLSYRPTQKYKFMRKHKVCVCLTDTHRNTNLWENTKAVSDLQTHTEIQMYEKRSKNNDCVVFY